LTRVKLVIEYDGTDLCGWQRQANGPTVQQHLEEALASICGEPIAITGASRTDAGVHATGQVAHFDWGARVLPLHGLVRALNSALPPAIAGRKAADIAGDFHARFDAAAKDYRYVIDNRGVRSPLLQRLTWWIRTPLELEVMREAGAHLIGEHDFAAFRATGCQAKTTTREIFGIRLTALPGPVISIDVRGNAFLRNMVRIVAGALTEVGRGRLTPGDIKQILESRDRTRNGQTAPPNGLCLRRVHYETPGREAPAKPSSIM
jgi:tRNA pseudouridine38-40 synthase